MGRSRRPTPRYRTWSVYSSPLGATRSTRAGFEVLAIEIERNLPAEVVSQSVVSQSPAAGASIPRGSLVLLYVAAPA